MIQFTGFSINLSINWFILNLIGPNLVGAVQSCYVGVVHIGNEFDTIVMSWYGGMLPGEHVATVTIHHSGWYIAGGVLW